MKSNGKQEIAAASTIKPNGKQEIATASTIKPNGKQEIATASTIKPKKRKTHALSQTKKMGAFQIVASSLRGAPTLRSGQTPRRSTSLRGAQRRSNPERANVLDCFASLAMTTVPRHCERRGTSREAIQWISGLLHSSPGFMY
ncbi:MAG: hypothetical protein LBF19_01775, partial [Prevotellaceae bacterium]|nr:hypothetical protein [Prevotellaceae bacterium]